MAPRRACIDGNEAAARVAYRLAEVVAIYPITPASPMGEAADAWSATGRPNLWGQVPTVIEMQSEAGAAGALHGAVQAGALATTFTASQGLLLMLPTMYKVAGEQSPAVLHVAARAVATHALSIFGDHSDVMAARATGWAMLASRTPQEAHDLALVAHAASLRSRVPVLHFFDGFRTSHQLDTVHLLDDDDLRALVRDEDVAAFRARSLSPDRPVVRGTSQNPDVFFASREAANPAYDAVPGTVAQCLDELAVRTGRRYGLVEYVGHPQAETVLVVMGSAGETADVTVEHLAARGQRVGAISVRLFRPFPAEALLAALPPTVRRVAVMDRTKEPGAPGEPLFLDVVAALHRGGRGAVAVHAARYGLGSHELTPADLEGWLDELAGPTPRPVVTLGITDDVTGLSVPPTDLVLTTGARQAVFFGLGSDGTVGANKSTTGIIGETTDLWAQAYFVYDSKKAGSVTVSHLRFGPERIRAPYLIGPACGGADFVACHQFGLLARMDVLGVAAEGATVLLNSPHPPAEVWSHLPAEVQEQVLRKRLHLWVVDAHRVAREVGLGGRINTVMQPCFFALSGVLPESRALEALRASVIHAYTKRGPAVVERNLLAIERSLAALHEVTVPADAVVDGRPRPAVAVPAGAPAFVGDVTAVLVAGEGDRLPVSALPTDGTYPTGTAAIERRGLAQTMPIWDPSLCIDCGKCAIVCPHAAIRTKVYPADLLADAPDGFQSKEYRSRDLPGALFTVQVAPDDCTGCGICVDVCPARSKEDARHKSLDLAPADERRDIERPAWDFFLGIPEVDRAAVRHDTVKGSQLLQPLFEFSGACSGCGETPYLKLLSQLFGDRLVIGNATGCSSIYGGNLPTTPWTTNGDGRGPAWANSLFEDNAEFTLGLRLGLHAQAEEARRLLADLAPALGDELVGALLVSTQATDADVTAQRARVEVLRHRLAALAAEAPIDPAVRTLLQLSEHLVRRSVWAVGGDGWAYDIGFGGLDHLLSTNADVNVLVLDTEVYSNTGGQASKATPRGAAAKFASSGKPSAKKDLGAFARAYGNVYVAQIALGANETQTVRALLEADAWPGPSLVIAYSTCIAHGIDMTTSMGHQRDAVASGHWSLYRYRPETDEHSLPFHLDSKPPTMPLRDFLLTETRFAALARSDPAHARHLFALAQADVDERRRYYAQLSGVERALPQDHGESFDTPEEDEA
jgi:pyruvate-ferredoxin/flavodoxin oxidoreductase